MGTVVTVVWTADVGAPLILWVRPIFRRFHLRLLGIIAPQHCDTDGKWRGHIAHPLTVWYSIYIYIQGIMNNSQQCASRNIVCYFCWVCTTLGYVINCTWRMSRVTMRSAHNSTTLNNIWTNLRAFACHKFARVVNASVCTKFAPSHLNTTIHAASIRLCVAV